MSNRPNEFPPPENVPEWAAYQPGMARQYGAQRQAAPAPTYPGQAPSYSGHAPTQPPYVPLPQGIPPQQYGYGYPNPTTAQPQYGAVQYGHAPVGPGQVSYIPVAASKPANGAAITSLVLGVLAATYGLTMVGGFLFGAIAIPFGIAGLARSRHIGNSGRGLSWWGIWLGAAGIALATFMVAAAGFWSAASDDDCYYDEGEYSEEADYNDFDSI